ncbi:MAG: hypothetical protein J6L88_01335 [Clostridia bacterium]|nr:hypothetical protein [Clostridia bacterium]
MKKILYWCVQLSWGLLQTALGFCIYLSQKNRTHFIYRGAIVTRWNKQTSLSLGPFLFVAEHLDGERYEHILQHEFGHTIQSLVLGPLYLILIGVPSFIWCNLPYFKKLRASGVDYDAFFIEANASYMGKKLLKKNAIDT